MELSTVKQQAILKLQKEFEYIKFIENLIRKISNNYSEEIIKRL